MKKKYGGKLGGWQLHKLTGNKEWRAKLKKNYPNAITTPNPLIVTGIVKEDPTGRWGNGGHFRSSLIVSIDRVRNRIETNNTYYDFDPKLEGKDPYVSGNMGNRVMELFY